MFPLLWDLGYNYCVSWDWFTAAMKAAGHTQTSIGAAVGESQQTVSMWASGKRFPAAKRVRRLAEELGVTPEELLTQIEVLDVTETPESDRATTRRDLAAMEQELLRLETENRRLREGRTQT